MQFEKHKFENREGEKLAARIDFPAGSIRSFALFAHCFTCTKNLKAISHISRSLTSRGIAVLRFDFTGLGESEGDFADTNFSSNVSDLVDAADFLEKHYQAPQLLIGHSLGGAAILQAAGAIDSAVAVATIGSPCDPEHVTALFESSREQIERDGEATVSLAGRPFKIKKQFLDDLEESSMQDKIRNLGKALLVLHSPVDNTVGIENAARIFKAARHPKSFLSLDHADHLLMTEDDARYAGEAIAAWASRYLPQEVDIKPQSSQHEGVVVLTGAEGYTTQVNAHGHHLVADEPLSYGGADLGPSPYEFLSTALGACTSMTLRMYADRKQWPLEAIRVALKHEKIHAEDCEDCDTPKGKIDQITRVITLAGDLDDSQKERLLEIADRCPVHRTLHSEIHVVTKLAT